MGLTLCLIPTSIGYENNSTTKSNIQVAEVNAAYVQYNSSATSNTTTTRRSSSSNATTYTPTSASSSSTNTSTSSQTTTTTTSKQFTITQIGIAAGTVKNYIESNGRLPQTVTIDTQQISMPQFLYLLTSSLIKVKNGDTSPVTLSKNYSAPSQPIDQIKSGNIAKTEYLSIATKIKSYLETNSSAPNYASSSLGKIGYESQVYMFSRIMNFYATKKALPNYVTMQPWGTNSSTTSNNNTNSNSGTIISSGAYNYPGPKSYIVTKEYVQATALCNCGKGTYTYETHAFKNYCPWCGAVGSLFMNCNSKYSPEGNWRCSVCGADYCAQCGKENVTSNPKWLTPYTV